MRSNAASSCVALLITLAATSAAGKANAAAASAGMRDSDSGAAVPVLDMSRTASTSAQSEYLYMRECGKR
ncbi:hypothetical protein CF68_21625 [Cupriavidus sp. SK-4]|nr:hypothetical protein CF68_21625 [Cupriavidus sp. SK-4]